VSAALLVGASLSSAVTGAAAAPTCVTAPTLDLSNPSPGALLSAGDLIVSGVARDPNAATGDGIDRVELFIGTRDSGGTEIGNGTTQAGNFVITAKLPTNITGGTDFVAYAHSSVTGQETSVSVPVFVGAEPTPTPRPSNSVAAPVLTATTQSTTECTPAPAAPAAQAAGTPAPSSTTSATAASAVPVLSLANPNSGDLVPIGDLVVSGTASVPGVQGGVDRVDFFIGNRDQGGTSVGSAVPSQGGFSTTLDLSSRFAGGNTLYAYAHNAVTGQETVVSVPIFIGAAPTPTPRPS
jgi:hypothetical protein